MRNVRVCAWAGWVMKRGYAGVIAESRLRSACDGAGARSARAPRFWVGAPQSFIMGRCLGHDHEPLKSTVPATPPSLNTSTSATLNASSTYNIEALHPISGAAVIISSSHLHHVQEQL